MFSTPFLHLGGDEVPVSCWQGSADVTNWMKEQHIAPDDFDSVERYFVNRVANLPSVTSSKRTMMYWEEVFNNNASISPAAIIQAWKSNAMPGLQLCHESYHVVDVHKFALCSLCRRCLSMLRTESCSQGWTYGHKFLQMVPQSRMQQLRRWALGRLLCKGGTVFTPCHTIRLLGP